MSTPCKPVTLARVVITTLGVARVEFPEKNMAGHIRRLGIQNYAAFDHDGGVAGSAARYEAAARLLARHYGLLDQHMIDVEIVHAYRPGRSVGTKIETLPRRVMLNRVT